MMKFLPGSYAVLLALPSPVAARSPVEVLLTGALETDAGARSVVELRILNSGGSTEQMILPDRIEARLEDAGSVRNIWLTRADATASELMVPASGFALALYQIEAHEASAGSLLSIPAWSTPTVRLHDATSARFAATGESAPTVRKTEIVAANSPVDRRSGNAFIDNLAPYEPIYGVYGPGTNSEARLQISFKYRLFGMKSGEGERTSWRNGLHFAYTQRMFWDLGANSSPFRNIDFQPELIYTTPSRVLTSGVSIVGQAGIRHESNGRDGLDSRCINSLYVMPMAALPLAGDYDLVVAPRLSLYVGDKSDNPDIVRYRGHAGLFMEVGDNEGLRLSTSTRFNFGSGKGAINADLSYPLPRLLGGGPDVYLFAQSFHGYGENLLDYNRRTSRLRIGIALVR
ncbi:phospholipase A [Sphingobium sp. CCH11-B1]|uniref:phospholipase A n=1 Tax=Sphingobium sp. CCH11-B1 TaxID=1768781 RepID=UPI0008354C12|nr:phospholipase A [Sphingobium sp. CCH11-B1]